MSTLIVLQPLRPLYLRTSVAIPDGRLRIARRGEQPCPTLGTSGRFIAGDSRARRWVASRLQKLVSQLSRTNSPVSYRPLIVLATDFSKAVSLDSTHTNARAELQTVQSYLRTRPTQDWPEDELECDPAVDDEPLEREDESDTEDFAHTGNGSPCKIYNGNGCTRGRRCQFRHAPDSSSVRDELYVPRSIVSFV